MSDRLRAQMLIRQTPPHFAYVFASLLGLVFDLIIFFSSILIALGVLLIGVTLLLPVFFRLLSAIGYPFPANMQDMFTDLRDLNGGTLLRSLMLLPPIAIVMIRESIARPFRTWRGLIISLVGQIDLASFLQDDGSLNFAATDKHHPISGAKTICSSDHKLAAAPPLLTRLGAMRRIRLTSLRLSTSGILTGSFRLNISATRSCRRKVTRNRNFTPVIVRLRVQML
ncbi:MAG: hypothetical protein AB8B71_15920, partial [Paracoccaceae bacterium]